LTPAEVRQHHPGLEVDVLGGSYFPSDAHVNPNLFMKQIREVGEKKGITSFSNTAVTGFKTEKGQIRALATADGQLIPTDQVVLAAGGWTARLARQLGIQTTAYREVKAIPSPLIGKTKNQLCRLSLPKRRWR
jgi:D-amino-acid dehydrogenase